MHLRNLRSMAVWMLGAGLAASACAQDAATLTPQAQDQATYISGGVGKDEAQLAEVIARYGYNMQLVFAEQTGAFLADVNLQITDAAGNTVLDTVSEGPMFLAKLPPGEYKVAAEVNGQVRNATVNAVGDAKRTTLVWPKTTDRQGDELPSVTGLQH